MRWLVALGLLSTSCSLLIEAGDNRCGDGRCALLDSGVAVADAPLIDAPVVDGPGIVLSQVSSGKSAMPTTMFSFSHEVSAQGHLLIVGAMMRSSSETFVALKYEDQPLDNLTAITAGDVRLEVWYLPAPSPGIGQVSLVPSGSQNICATALSYSGVDLASPFGGAAVAEGMTGELFVNVSSAEGEEVVAFFGQYFANGEFGGLTVGTGHEELALVEHSLEAFRLYSASKPGESVVTLSATVTGDPDYAAIAMPLKPSM